MRKASAWRLSTVLGSMLLAFIGQAFSVAGAQEARTVKERLSDKASDNQRVDNCHVLVERADPSLAPIVLLSCTRRRLRRRPGRVRRRKHSDLAAPAPPTSSCRWGLSTRSPSHRTPNASGRRSNSRRFGFGGKSAMILAVVSSDL